MSISRTADREVTVGPRIMLPLIIAAMLNPINSSVLAIALTPIALDFPHDEYLTAWLIAALYLAAAIAQPILGRVADLYGTRRILAFGLGTVALGGTIGAIAATAETLILSRVLIGIGTSAGYPCSVAFLRQWAEQRGVETPANALAVLTTTGNVASAFGPVLGGLIVGVLGWRWVFLINLPIAIIGIVLLFLYLPLDSKRETDFKLRQLDMSGMLLFTGAMISSLLFLMQLPGGTNYPLLLITVLLASVLVKVEDHRDTPFIDMSLLIRNRSTSVIYLRHALIQTILYSGFYSLPQWMQGSQGYSPEKSGLLMLPIAVFSALATFAVSRSGNKRAARTWGGILLLLSCILMMLLSIATPEKSLYLIVLFCSCQGASYGTLTMLNQLEILRLVPVASTGVASGLLRTAQYTGATFAAALTAMVIGNQADAGSLRLLALYLLPLMALVLPLLVINQVFRVRQV